MRRSALVLVIIGVVALTAVWWLTVVGGADERVAIAEDESASLRLQESQLGDLVVSLNDATERRPQYLQGLRTIEGSVPVQPQLDRFIEQLNQLAASTGVSLVAIGTSEPRPHVGEPPLDVLVIDLDLAVEARFFDLLGFLFALEDLERLVVVDSLSVNPSGARPDPDDPASFESDLLSVSLSATLYTRTATGVTLADAEGDGS